MKKKLKEELLRKATDGKISCAAARDIAEELNIPYREIGKAADELGIRIKACQLGCF